MSRRHAVPVFRTTMNFAPNTRREFSPVSRAEAAAVRRVLERDREFRAIREVACVLAGYVVLCAMLVFAALHS